MNVVYFCSDFFAEICGVSIESLFENNKDINSITCYVVEKNISEVNKKRLVSIAKEKERKIIFIKMPDQKDVFPEVNINLGNAYARMAIGELLPKDVDRILMLDCDTLVLDSLKNMYETYFDENEYVAGVYDCVGEAYQRKVLKAPDDMKYCNAGMFLVDLTKWRDKGIKEQILNAFGDSSCSKFFFLEQDILNKVFYSHLKLLGLRYNIITSLNFFRYDEVIYMKHPTKFYSEKEFYEARKNPAIIHGATCFYIKKRMWVQGSDHPHAKTYIEYRKKTPWKDIPMIKDQRTLGKKAYALFWHVLPRNISVSLAGFLMKYVRPMYAKMAVMLKFNTVAKRSAT